MIQTKKFYTTLPHKLDQAEAEFHEAQPDKDVQWDTIEVGKFGEDGWSISTTFKPSKSDD
tara:strand:- start:798 stop:977 length:180 start_codon:yes stop_codon:yes gene_type:complete